MSTAVELLSTLPAKFDAALASGNLHHFPSTIHQHVEDDIPVRPDGILQLNARSLTRSSQSRPSVQFQIRLCPALAQKPTLPVPDAGLGQGTEGVKVDPFAPPYNPHLYVGQLQNEDAEYVVLVCFPERA
jgi:ATP adenylyltransferase